jgi:hypothetical protein
MNAGRPGSGATERVCLNLVLTRWNSCNGRRRGDSAFAFASGCDSSIVCYDFDSAPIQAICFYSLAAGFDRFKVGRKWGSRRRASGMPDFQELVPKFISMTTA